MAISELPSQIGAEVSLTTSLERLVGGSLTAGKVSVDPIGDPDEDSATGPERILGPIDKIDYWVHLLGWIQIRLLF